MGHKCVTVQQRLLWDWSMEMERGACEETRATETVDIRKQGCLINKSHNYSISMHA